ncbi:MAG: enoyl-CoA hydratase/isomerase family protein [Actinobacteria bacterium]|nr:MAG: enoyl-CoA hydratase/isomerase family protein [Actinomycetota bacterium]
MIEIERDGAVCLLTLNRPEKLNALSSSLETALGEELDGEAVRTSACVVIAGEGRAFSAGADLTELGERTPEGVAAYYQGAGHVYERVAALPQPTIAAIHGYCLGGGLELALATDFRVADRTAVFGFPEVSLGILPSSGGTHRLVRLAGPARAKHLMLLGGRFGPDEALAAGLLTDVVEEGGARARALELGRQLAEQPRLAVSLTKQAIDVMPEASRQAGILLERLAYGMLSQTEDHRQS